MNILLDKNLLLSPLTKLVSITERRSIMPILSNLLVDFSRTGIMLYSTDLEVSAISHVEQTLDFDKRIVVHGRKFLEILKEMENEPVNLEISDNTLTLKQRQTEFVLGLQDPQEFPDVREISAIEEFSMSGEAFLTMLDKVNFAISSDETRYVLTGMYMIGSEGRITAVGTDGFRMSLYHADIQGVKPFKGIIVPKRSVMEAGRVVNSDDTVTCKIGEKHIQFGTGSVTIISRLIEGGFPDYENVIPKTNTNIASLDKAKLLKGLRKVSTIISKSEPIKVNFVGNTIEIEAESEVGRAREVIEISYEGETLNLNFNIRFLLDVCTHIDGDAITIKAPSTYGAVLFEDKNEDNYKNIVMPIRV
jgi:DNA polymerase-3 subunit beta